VHWLLRTVRASVATGTWGAVAPYWFYTEADLCPNAIGDGPRVADHVRCVGYSDRAHAPFASDVNLLCDLDGVIDLDAEVTNGALDLRMTERLGFILRIS